MILDSNKIIRKMNEQALTIAECENKYNISHATLTKARTNQSISQSSVKKLCEIFDCKPIDLLKEED